MRPAYALVATIASIFVGALAGYVVGDGDAQMTAWIAAIATVVFFSLAS